MTDNLPTTIEHKSEIVANDVRDDLNTARENIKTVITQTAEAVIAAADLAGVSQSDKYYIALNQLLKTSLEANRDLVDLHRRKKDIIGKEGPKTQVNQLIMTSSDMLKVIKGEKI